MTTIDITVNGMTCNHCKMRVEKALKGLPGVRDAQVSLEKKLVKVNFDETLVKIDALQNAITGEGYEVAS